MDQAYILPRRGAILPRGGPISKNCDAALASDCLALRFFLRLIFIGRFKILFIGVNKQGHDNPFEIFRAKKHERVLLGPGNIYLGG